MLKRTIEIAKSKAPEGILVAFLALIGYFGGQIWHSISAPLLQYILPAIPGSILMPLSLLLFLLLLASFAYILHLHRLVKAPNNPGIAQDEWSSYKPMTNTDGFVYFKNTETPGMFACATCKGKEEHPIILQPVHNPHTAGVYQCAVCHTWGVIL